MKFNPPPCPLVVDKRKPEVGDVFLSKGTGPRSYRAGTRFWLLAGITPGKWNNEVHHFLGLSEEGQINSTTSYGGHVAEGWTRVGHCPDFGSSMNIDWLIDSKED